MAKKKADTQGKKKTKATEKKTTETTEEKPKKKKSMLSGVRISKTVQRGPLRLNISKSGVGVSAGVPNFRVGIGPSGKYVSIFGRRTKLTKDLLGGLLKSFLD